MPTRSVADAERQFLMQVLGVTVGQIDDLRLKFYEGVINGTVSLGGGPSPGYHQAITVGNVRTGGAIPDGNYWTNVAPNTALFYPVYYENTFAIDGMSIAYRGGLAASTGRLGLFRDNGSFKPGTLIKETTVSAVGASWVSSTFAAVTGLAKGWYWHAAVQQGGAGGQDVFSLSNAECTWFDAPTLENAVRTDSALNGCYQATIAGAYANNPTVTLVGNRPFRVGMRFA